MSEEIAVLGIEVRTNSVAEGTQKLDRLTEAGGKAEKATVALANASNKVNEQIGQMGQKAQGAGQSFTQLDTGIQKVAQSTQKASAEFKGLAAASESSSVSVAKMAASAVSFAAFAYGIKGVSLALIDAQRATEKLSNTLQYAFGAENVAGEMEYLRNVTRSLGIDFSTSAQAFVKFAAATKTAGFSANETKTVFEGVAGAAAKMGLSADETQGAFLALSQMASKGTVSAEELRGQLAERLPGAFAIAAKSMGVTQKELGKLLETGQLMASDFLPKFGQALKDEFQAPLTSLTQEINRLTSAWDIWKGSLADADGGSFKFLTNGLNESSAAMRALGKEAGIVQKLLVAIGGFQAGAIGAGKFDTQKLQQDAMAQLAMVSGGRRSLEGKNLNYLQQEQLRDLIRQETELRSTLLQLAERRGRETFKPPDIAGEYSAQQAKKAEAFKSYMSEVQGEKEKQVAKENERWSALKAIIGTSGADYEKALSAHNDKLAEINKKGAGANSSKNDLAQISKAYIDQLKSDSNTEIELVKDRVAQRLLAEESGIEQIKAIRIKEAQDEVAILAKRYSGSNDKGERAALIADMQKASNAATKAVSDAEDSMAKLDAAYLKQQQSRTASLASETESLLQKAEAAEFELQTIGLSADQLAILTARRYDEQIAIQQGELDRLNAIDDRGEENDRITAQIYLIEQKIDALNRLKNVEITKPRLQEQAREWQRFSDDIERSLTDALMRGFESGKSFGENFIDSLKNSLKTSALKIVVNYVTNGAGNLVGTLGNAAINGVLGTSGNNDGAGKNYLGLASTAQSGYNAYSTAASIYANGWGATAGSAMTGAGNLLGSTGLAAYGAGYGAGLSTVSPAIAAYNAAAAEAIAAGNIAQAQVYANTATQLAAGGAAPGAAAGGSAAGGSAAGAGGATLGTALGWAAVWAAVSVAIDKWGGGKVTQDYQSLRGSFSKDGFTGDIGQAYNSESGWFRQGKSWDVWTPLEGTLDEYLQSFASGLGTNLFSANSPGDVSSVYDGSYAKNQAGEYQLIASIDDLRNSLDGQIYQKVAVNAAAPVSDGNGSPIIDIDGRVTYATQDEFRNVTKTAMGGATTDIHVLDNLNSYLDVMYLGVKDTFVKMGASFDDASIAAKLENFTMAISEVRTTNMGEAMTDIANQLTEGMAKSLLPSVATVNAAMVAKVADLNTQMEAATKKGDTTLADALKKQIEAGTETWSQTYVRLLSETTEVSNVFKTLGSSITDAFGKGNVDNILQLSDAFVQLMGGLDVMKTKVNSYIENFYSADEKSAIGWKAMQESFDGLSLAMPTTREGFRALADGMDKTTVAGVAQYAALLGLADGFAALTPAIDAAVETLATSATTLLGMIDTQQSRVKSNAVAYMASLTKSVELERTRITAIETAADESVSSIKGIFDLLKDQVIGLYGTVSSSAEMQATQGNAFIDNALATAQTTGYLPDQTDLAAAISAARAGLDSGNFASQVDSDRAALVLAGKLSQLKDVSASQLPVAEQALKVAKDQLSALDSLVDLYQAQVDAALGLAEVSFTFEGSLDNMGRAIVAAIQKQTMDLSSVILQQALSGAIPTGDAAKKLVASGVNADTLTNIGGVSSMVSSNGAIMAAGKVLSTNGYVGSEADAKKIIYDAFTQMAPTDFYTKAVQVGLSGAMIEQLFGYSAGTADQWAQANNLPSFSGSTAATPNPTPAATPTPAPTPAASLTGDALKNSLLADFASMSPHAFREKAISLGVSGAMIDQMMGFPSGTSRQWALDNGLPSFAVGSPYIPHDMTANIHRGEMVIDPASSNVLRRYGINVNGANDAMVEELKSLRTELVEIRRQLDTANQSAKRTADATNGRPEAPLLVEVV